MDRWLITASLAVTLCVWPLPATGQNHTLTLDQALAWARARAPVLLAARARIDEARGRLVGASILFSENPLIEVAAGRRRAAEAGQRDSSVDAEFGISQMVELGGRRRARIAGAEARVTREIASSEDAARRLLRDVAAAFVRVLHASEHQQLTTRVDTVLAEVLRASERRYQLGDISALDVNVAKSASARARAEVLAAEAAHEQTLGDLRVLLGMSAEEPVAVHGDLRERRHYDLPELIARVQNRPDLRALVAEIDEAEAEVRLGESFAWPEVGLGVRYQRESETEHVTLGTLTFTLPAFARGQELRTTGVARARRLRQELTAGHRTASVEVRTAFAVYRRRSEAVEELERKALPVLDDSDALAQRSYEAGQISLAEFLLLRRETLETRLAYLDRLLEVAVAGIELEARAGVLQ